MLLVSAIFLALHAPSPTWAAPKKAKGLPKFHVVIDPGHGGQDLGTTHKKGGVVVTEKEIALAIALETAKAVRAKGMLVTLTRETDRELALADRTALANRMKADLFFSIHLNSPGADPARQPEGIETYILNTTTDQSSRRLAKLENAVLGTTIDEADGQTEVALILKDLKLDANLPESKRIACLLQKGLVQLWTARGPNPEVDRGVKQALFHVLLGADMPSALVEVGFLSHPRDRLNVVSTGGRKKIADVIAQAVAKFRDGRGKPEALRELSSCKVR
ncbi:MAG: N-acetylmuramoyl-L-alanine amidase [Bdellovibrionales bacterium]|nr:N-acetylmuramoyl-L-alanine amidase [Bdellovibrionales bacterium]